MTELSCSEQSCAVGEGLAGTAAEAGSWLLLEYPHEWKPKGYEQARLPERTRAVIDVAVQCNPSLRVQLIRRSERRIVELGVRLFLARSERDHEQLWELRLPDYDAVASLDLNAWALGSDPFPEARRGKPLYIVCVHGKRDRCCAQKGIPVYRRLCALRPDETWQTTHLGGHRFAATLVCLPSGVCYGRVVEHDVDALVAALDRGELSNLERYRGRSCDDATTQAAEMLLRAELQELGIGALRPQVNVTEGARATVAGQVTFQDANGAQYVVTVASRTLPLIQQSCDAAERKPARIFVRV